MRKLALIIGIAILGSPAWGARKPIAPSPFGIGLHSMEGSVENHQTTIDLCRQAGIKLIRDEIHWGRVEQEKGVLKVDDNIMRNVENTLKADIEPMIILDYGNKFYDDGNAPVSKEAVEGFARYCEFMTRTFKGKIRYWEIWNEPNIEHFWRPKPNARDYANLLKAAYQACKRGNRDCVVIGLATAEVPFSYIESVLKDGTSKYMDVLSVHPYRYPATPEASHLSGDIKKLRELMDQSGAKDKPIWITEIGWPTHQGSRGVTPERQADMLVRAYLESMASGVESVFWYWFGNDGPDPAYNEHHFGIRFADGSPKPAYSAYRTMTRHLEGTQFSRSLWLGESTRAYVFSRGKSEVVVMWCSDGATPVSIVGGEVVTVTDERAGESESFTLEPVNNLVSLSLTESPRYITRKSAIDQASVLPVGAYQFAPPQMTITPGDTNTLGIQIANLGKEPVKGTVSIGSDFVEPRKHEYSLDAVKKTLLVSKLILPPSTPAGVLMIPAEVEMDDKLVARLEMPVKITPLASIEVRPSADNKAEITVTNMRNSALSGKLFVDIAPYASKATQEFPIDGIKPGESAVFRAAPNDPTFAPDTIYDVKTRLTASDGATVEHTAAIDFLAAGRAKGPVTIDGKLDEWEGAAQVRLNRREQITVGADTWQGPSDSSATVYTMWDDDSLYFAAKVMDNIRSAELYGEKMHNSDGIEIYLDTDLQGDRTERKYSKDDFQYGCFNSPDGPVLWNWQPARGASPAGKCAFVYDESLGPGGYVIEIRIPMSEMGLKPEVGKSIGFGIGLDDDDSPEGHNAFRQERHFTWTGGQDNWLDPTQFGTLRLQQ